MAGVHKNWFDKHLFLKGQIGAKPLCPDVTTAEVWPDRPRVVAVAPMAVRDLPDADSGRVGIALSVGILLVGFASQNVAVHGRVGFVVLGGKQHNQYFQQDSSHLNHLGGNSQFIKFVFKINILGHILSGDDDPVLVIHSRHIYGFEPFPDQAVPHNVLHLILKHHQGSFVGAVLLRDFIIIHGIEKLPRNLNGKLLEQLQNVTPAQACKHPNWSMGQKISVDSATLMNKGLELIEACHLFAISEQFVTVVVHPQSIIHSMVQYVDGSTLAQMGNPDMCTPIAHALAWPERIQTHVPALDLFMNQHLDFQEPDTTRFPALKLARQAMQSGGLAPAILNAANEVAVAAFLNKAIAFTEIPQVVERTLNQVENSAAESIELILQADRVARSAAQQIVINNGS